VNPGLLSYVASYEVASNICQALFRGDGTLPHVTVEEPAALDERGAPLVKFPRLLLGKRLTRPITLRNNGIIPAVCRVDMAGGLLRTHTGPTLNLLFLLKASV